MKLSTEQLKELRVLCNDSTAWASVLDELIAIRELKGEQVPVGTGIFTRDELAEVCKARVRDMPENYADHQIAKVALRSLFTAPQKPVALPVADHETEDGYKYYREETVKAAIEAAGGIVKDNSTDHIGDKNV